jgi:hypothetical protein
LLFTIWAVNLQLSTRPCMIPCSSFLRRSVTVALSYYFSYCASKASKLCKSRPTFTAHSYHWCCSSFLPIYLNFTLTLQP